MEGAAAAAAPEVKGTERLTQEQAKALAAVPGNVVYTYDYEEPRGYMDPARQLQAASDIIARFDYQTFMHPEEPLEALRERVLQYDPAYREFAGLYPAVFSRLTQLKDDDYPEETERELDMLRKGVLVMLEARAKMAADKMSADQQELLKAAVMSNMASLCVVDAPPVEEGGRHVTFSAASAAAAAGAGDPEAAEATPKITRTDVSDMGQALVRQKPGCTVLRSAPVKRPP